MLDQPTATLIAGIVTATGSTIVGVSAVVFAALQNRKTLSQQREMAIDERLFERRAEVYVDLLKLLLYVKGEKSDAGLTDALQGLAPQIVAFASNQVDEQFHPLMFASWLPGMDDDARAERIGIMLDSLMSMVKGELQPGSHEAEHKTRRKLEVALRRVRSWQRIKATVKRKVLPGRKNT